MPISHDITASGLQVLRARDNLIGLAKTRFGSQLVKPNNAEDDLLQTRLSDKVKKPKMGKA